MDPYSENKTKWNKRAAHYDRSRKAKAFQAIQRQTIDALDVQAGMTVLDLGCGTGWALQYVYAQTNGKGTYIGIDLSEQMIAIAKTRFKDKPAVQLVCSAAEHFNRPPHTVDRIMMSSTFHHLADPKKVLDNISTLLKPEGRFCIADITADKCIVRIANKILQQTERAHMSFYSTRQYEILFRQAGLFLVSVHAVNPYFKLLIGGAGIHSSNKKNI